MQCPVIDEVMQPAVHALVLVAQSQAGMWRRNGYSLQNQVICLIITLVVNNVSDVIGDYNNGGDVCVDQVTVNINCLITVLFLPMLLPVI